MGIGLGGSLGADELLPCLVAFVDDLDGVLLGLGLSGEGKDVLRISVVNNDWTIEQSSVSRYCDHLPLAFHRGFCRFGTTRW